MTMTAYQRLQKSFALKAGHELEGRWSLAKKVSTGCPFSEKDRHDKRLRNQNFTIFDLRGSSREKFQIIKS